MRDYVACIEEISQIISISNRKLDFLERLRQDCVALDMDNDINIDDSAHEMTAVQRIDWATDLIKKNYSHMQRTRDDLKLSLDVVSYSIHLGVLSLIYLLALPVAYNGAE